MKLHLILFTTFLFVSLPTLAAHNDCIAKLTNDFYTDSSYHVRDESNEVWTKDLKASAIKAIRRLLESFNCSPKDYSFGKGAYGRSKSTCLYAFENMPATLYCYIETDIGYFTLTKDLQENAHIIYHRWD